MQRLLRVLLGLFVLWQLLFLITANGVAVLDVVRPLQTVTPSAEKVTTRWAEVTGQPQRWSLFAPDVGPDVTFPAVELRWDGAREPVPHLSDNEPEDVRHYLRIGRFRLRRYESTIDLFLPEPNPETDQRTVDGWNRQIDDKVRSDWRYILAYLRWCADRYHRAHPDELHPTEAILYLRWYRVTEPGADHAWDGPESWPIARWRVDSHPGDEFLPLERYNPVVERFVRVRRTP